MKLSRSIFLPIQLILFIFVGDYCFGQSNFTSDKSEGYFKNNQETEELFKTPQTATLGSFGGIGVNYYTGQPDISIPLYTLSSGKLSLPLTMVYNSTGVKVSDISSWVGMSWELLAGGFITRDINGIPDETNPRGYFYTGLYVDDYCNNSSITKDWIANVQDKDFSKRKDSEPDKFYFNFLGKNGTFIYDKNKNPILLNKEAYEIAEIVVEDKLIGFILTTPDGIKFTFGTIDNAIEQIKVSTLTIPFEYGFEYRYDPVDAQCNNGKKKYDGKKIISWLDENITSNPLDNDEIIAPSSYHSLYYSNSGSINQISIIKDDIEKVESTNGFVNNKWYLTKIMFPDGGDFIEFTYNDIGEISYVTTPQVVSSMYEYVKNQYSRNDFYIEYPNPYDNTTWRSNSCLSGVPDKYYVIFGSWNEWYNGIWIDPGLVDNSSYDYHMGLRTPPMNTFISQNKIFIKRKSLSEIKTRSGHRISFQTSKTIRTDMPGEVALERIMVTNNKGSLIKQFDFNYDIILSDLLKQNTIEDPLSLAEALMKKWDGTYVHSDFEGFIAEGLKEYNYKRLFLKSITELGQTPYEMEYKTDDFMPRKTSLMVNLYGFPRKYTDIATRDDKKIVFGFQPATAGVFSNGNEIGNKISNSTEKSSYGILKKIKYPTGGYSVFEFEEHILNTAVGNRISKILDYSDQNTISLIKEYKYEGLSQVNIPANSARIDYCFPFQLWTEDWFLFRQAYPYLFTYFHPIQYRTSFSLKEIEMVQGSFVGYSKVTEFKRNNLEENDLIGSFGREEYYFKNPDINNNISNSWIMPFENDKKNDFRGKVGYPNSNLYCVPNSKIYNERGLIEKHIAFNYLGAKLEETKYYYIPDSVSNIIKGFVGHMQKWKYFDREWYNMNSTPGAVEKKWSFYLWGKYSYEIKKSYISSVVKSIYDPTNENIVLNSTISYTYNNKGQILSATNLDSKGSEIKQKFKYPQDYQNYLTLIFPDEPYARAIHILRYKNIIANPIETTTWKDNKLVSATLQLYQSSGTSIFTGFKVFPYQTYQLDLNEPVSDFYPSRITYEGTSRIFKKDGRYKLVNTFGPYDDNGNILQVSKENDLNKSYIWGYNGQYPIAEVVNAENNEIAYTSFEDPEDGSVKYVTNKKHLGKYSYKLNSNDWIDFAFLKVPKSQAAGIYNASVWIYTPDYNGTENIANFGYYIKDKNNNILKQLSYYVSKSYNGWKKIDYSFTIDDALIAQNTTNEFILNPIMYTRQKCDVYIDDFRFHPSDAQMSTYTYEPLVGITSVTGPDNRTTTYEYDDFGRLKCIKDHEGNIIEYYDYHYKE